VRPHEHHDHDTGARLLPLDEARRRALAHIRPLPPVELSLRQAHGCVLAAAVAAVFQSSVWTVSFIATAPGPAASPMTSQVPAVSVSACQEGATPTPLALSTRPEAAAAKRT